MPKNRKSFLVFALSYGLFCMLAYGSSYAEDSIQKDGRVSRAEKAIADFQGALKTELMTAMTKGGPEAAVNICNEKAPQIALTLSDKHNLELRRTSLRLRNPGNKPSAEEKEALEDFERRKNQGESISALKAVLQTNEGLRYMKAIPMQGMCAACHGSKIEPKLYQKIKTYYPDDNATGYEDGDIRGAFSVLLQAESSSSDKYQEKTLKYPAAKK